MTTEPGATERLRETLRAHERNLLALGRTMVEPRPDNWEPLLGERIAAVVNGIPAVRAALAAPSESSDLLAAVEARIRERWLATVEWDGNGSRAEWTCLVCGRYDKHRVDASDYCPIAFVLDVISESRAAPPAEMGSDQ